MNKNIPLLFIVYFLSCQTAFAADTLAPLNFKGIYEFRLGGLLVGKLGIEAEESASGYAIACDIKSAGVASIFTKHSSHTTVDGTYNRTSYPDIVYQTNYQTKKKKRSVRLVYKDAEITKEEVVPPDNRATRPAVDAHLKNAAYDPLTLNIRLRQAVWNAVQSGKPDFTLSVYDGRRLTELNGAVEGKRTLRDGNRKQPVVTVSVRRKLVAGFTKSELEDYDPKEPALLMYYSNDRRFVPIRAEAPLLFGSLTGVLVKQCATGESCLFGIRE